MQTEDSNCGAPVFCSEPSPELHGLHSLGKRPNQKMGSRHQLAVNAKCAVCNDDASGFHYGVNSCEGCKGFFRRCITQGINFRCSNEERCQITPFTRNSCQYCRLKRCFQVGMSREASRLGRRPKKIIKSSGMSSRDFHTQLSKHMNTKSVSSPTGSNGSGQHWDYPDLANAALSDMFGCPPEMMDTLSKMMPSMMAGGGPMPGFHFPSMPVSQEMPHNAHVTSPMDLSSPGRISESSPASSEEVTHMDLSKWRERQFEVMSKYMHNKDSASSAGDQSESGSCHMTSGRNDEASSKDSSPSASSTDQVSPFGSGSFSMPMRSDITVTSDAQRQRLRLFMSYISLDKKEEMQDLILQVQNGIITSHLEHCYHQRPRINAVSAELDAKQLSGEDVRPPTGFWTHWMSELLPTIERVVRFLKDVPGFRELPINDQIILIKKGAYDIVLSQAMPMVDPDKCSILDPQLKYRNTREDFSKMPGPFRMLFEDYFVLAKEFKMTGITDIETSLINAILGVNSSIEGFENGKAVEKLECLFVQTLYDYVIKTYPDQPGRFESLILLIPIVDNASQAHTNSLHRIKGIVPINNTQFPPLHTELFS